MNRAAFLIDGFNLYYSLKQAHYVLGNKSTKWLDLKSLCSSYLHILGKDACLDRVVYFSALAQHLECVDPKITSRHLDYILCLESTGGQVELARFKQKTIRCPHCQSSITRYEEKETVVAISSRIFELLAHNSCDTIVLVTGDTDLAPAVRTARSLYPSALFCFAFPFGRVNRDLAKVSQLSFRIKNEQYLKHQFSDPFIDSKGNSIRKPLKW